MNTSFVLTTHPQPGFLHRVARMIGLRTTPRHSNPPATVEITIHVTSSADDHDVNAYSHNTYEPTQAAVVHPREPRSISPRTATVYSTPTPCTYDDDPLGW